MELVVLIGLQASDKSSFYRERWFHSHVRLSLEMLRMRRREATLREACLRAGQALVVDNTNPTRADRARYIEPARAAGFTVHGYYFDLDASMRVYETAHDHCVLPGIFMVARLDGRGFTKLTKETLQFEAPASPQAWGP